MSQGQGNSTGGRAAGLAARRERVGGRVAEHAALALKLVGACRERVSGRVVGRAARALELDNGACQERASGRVAEQVALTLVLCWRLPRARQRPRRRAGGPCSRS